LEGGLTNMTFHENLSEVPKLFRASVHTDGWLDCVNTLCPSQGCESTWRKYTTNNM
jgi:hypothetical protein